MTPLAADGKALLDAYAGRLNPQLALAIRQAQNHLSLVPASPMGDLFTRLAAFCRAGGKRLRPALLYWGYRLMGGKDSADILKASLVVELVHAFFLIHDDIMDESLLRRGKPTVHHAYAKRGRQHHAGVDPYHFGKSMAILVGDLAYALALEPLMDTGFADDLKLRVIQKINEMAITTIMGQELDLLLEARGHATEAEVLTMYRLKTANYSFVVPLQIGALLAEGDDRNLERLARVGLSLGVAFQMQDDLIGMFGDAKVTGKPAGADLVQGKQTLLAVRALKRGSKAQRDRLRALLGKKPLTHCEISEAQQIITATGAKASVKSLAKQHGQRAGRALDALRRHYRNPEASGALAAIAAYVINRDV